MRQRQAHSTGQTHPHRLAGILLALLASCAILLALASRAEGAQQVITTSGPLTKIYLNDDLGCQLNAAGDTSSEFFGGTNPGACGTFLSVNGTNTAVYGPSVPLGPTPNAGDFTSITQSAVTGSGTSASPYQVVSTDAVGATGLQITQTDSYVVGNPFYTTSITVRNTSDVPRSGTLFHAGDCFLANQDTGFGAVLSGAAFCTLTANNNPLSGTLGFIPVNSPGGSYVEGPFTTVWNDVASGAALPNTVDATTNQDNGTGISWPFSLPSGLFATETLQTQVVRGPTSTAASAGCGGLVNFTVTDAPGGPGAQSVHYILDGGAEQVLPTSGNPGTASFTVGDGNHSLMYWGENAAGIQESPRNTLPPLLVDTVPPVVSIASDLVTNSYSLGQFASITITASDATSGLASDPSAVQVPISTSVPGSFTIQRSATDKCGNTATASYTYKVTAPPPPPPVLFKSFNLSVLSGQVFVLLPGGKAARSGKQASAALPAKGLAGFVPLTEARQLPVGTVIDTTGGVAQVTSATNKKGKTQSGDFGAGIFKLLQKRGERAVVDLNLVVASTARRSCTTQLGKARAAAKRKKLSNHVLDLLRSNVHGQFRTRGRFSAATVRGTNWDMVERCDGTLTRVHRGIVVVADFRRHRNIVLRAGKIYLARAG